MARTEERGQDRRRETAQAVNVMASRMNSRDKRRLTGRGTEQVSRRDVKKETAEKSHTVKN